MKTLTLKDFSERIAELTKKFPDALVTVSTPITRSITEEDLEKNLDEELSEEYIEEEYDINDMIELPPGSYSIYPGEVAPDIPQLVVGEALDPVENVQVHQGHDDYPLIIIIRGTSTPQI